MKPITLPIALLALLALAAPATGQRVPGRAAPERCTITAAAAIYDGDTIRCADGRRVRLLNIDAPELDQGAGRSARDHLRTLLPPGSSVRLYLDVEAKDRYGRVLAHVERSDGLWINRALAHAGWVLPLVYPPNVAGIDAIRAASAAARRSRAGAWATDAFSCTPRDHRAGRC